MNTIDECQDVDKFLGVEICKNLFLCNSQKTKFYLLMMPGHKKFVTRDFCKQINSSRLSFAPPEYMEAYLDLTPGSASILGLMNDHEHHVQLVMDQEVVDQPLIGCHPCINTSSLTLATNDVLNKFLHIRTTTFFTSISKYIVYAHCIILMYMSKDCRYDEPSASSYGQSFL